MSEDKYRLLAIIVIIAINRNYCQQHVVMKSIIVILLKIYCYYLAIILIIWQLLRGGGMAQLPGSHHSLALMAASVPSVGVTIPNWGQM